MVETIARNWRALCCLDRVLGELTDWDSGEPAETENHPSTLHSLLRVYLVACFAPYSFTCCLTEFECELVDLVQ